MAIREATVADAAALAEVHLTTALAAYAGMFPSGARAPRLPEVIEEWQGAFADPTFRAFLAEDGGRAVGTVAVRADPEFAGCAQLRRLHTLPGLWGRGLGSSLHDTALDALRRSAYGAYGAYESYEAYEEAGLWVLEANTRARTFYERRGWTLVPGKVLEWQGLGTIEVRYRLALAVP